MINDDPDVEMQDIQLSPASVVVPLRVERSMEGLLAIRRRHRAKGRSRNTHIREQPSTTAEIARNSTGARNYTFEYLDNSRIDYSIRSVRLGTTDALAVGSQTFAIFVDRHGLTHAPRPDEKVLAFSRRQHPAGSLLPRPCRASGRNHPQTTGAAQYLAGRLVGTSRIVDATRIATAEPHPTPYPDPATLIAIYLQPNRSK